MKKFLYILFFLVIACKKESTEIINEASEEFPGGATTFLSIYSGSFEQGSANMNPTDITRHALGDADFEANFVTAPAAVNPGLGPIFNQISCVTCHQKNGKSAQPISGADLKGLLFRVSIPSADETHGATPIPGLGTQIQNKAIIGKQPEAQIQISFTTQNYTFPDGEAYSLRTPIYTITSSNTVIPTNMMVSPRIAQQVIGLGLLENISNVDILANQDINDVNGDGISGKANYVKNPLTGLLELGKFGWKANNPNLLVQNAGALHDDIGITSFVFPIETSYGQSQYDNLIDEPELDSQTVMDLTFYTQSLAVPKRRNFNDAATNNGKKIFFNIGCNKCHVQKFVTGNTSSNTFLNNQIIYPYTDLLLHDMGNALADGRPDFLATGNEWRTPPLWGIGLSELVMGHTNLLHDGRARNVLEAIMWHGGEAEQQKNNFSNLSKKDRDDLIKFVNAL